MKLNFKEMKIQAGIADTNCYLQDVRETRRHPCVRHSLLNLLTK